MATYQIMYWQDFPAQVKVNDEEETVRRLLPERFQQAIDGAAMAQGSTDTDSYLDGWQWGPQEERAGTAEAVAEALVAELDEAFPKQRLTEMVRSRSQPAAQKNGQ
jgi:hypothetical protein